MSFIERYLKGDTERVYAEIYQLKEDAFDPLIFPDVNLVLQETFKRVAFNLGIIHEELIIAKYLFYQDTGYDWQKPLLKPPTDTDNLLLVLKSRVKNVGYIPLSLEYFYKMVGSCNLCWDYKKNSEIPWEGADPLDIPPLKDLLEMVYDEYDNDDILLSGDDLQKDNVSGGCYNLELVKSPAIDSVLFHSNWNIPFIEYLRITFDNCGFSMADQCNYESLNLFCKKVKPKLRSI